MTAVCAVTLLMLAGCGDATGSKAVTEDGQSDDVLHIMADEKSGNEAWLVPDGDDWDDTVLTETTNITDAQDIVYDEVDTIVTGEPQLLALVPAFVVGTSSGGGWKLISRSIARNPGETASTGGKWRLRNAMP